MPGPSYAWGFLKNSLQVAIRQEPTDSTPFWSVSIEATGCTSAPAFGQDSNRPAAEPFMPSSHLSKTGLSLRQSAGS